MNRKVQKHMAENTTTKPMTATEQLALVDIKQWYGKNHPPRGSYNRYAWKPASMKKLAARGLVVQVGEYAGQMLWEITDAGYAAP